MYLYFKVMGFKIYDLFIRIQGWTDFGEIFLIQFSNFDYLIYFRTLSAIRRNRIAYQVG